MKTSVSKIILFICGSLLLSSVWAQDLETEELTSNPAPAPSAKHSAAAKEKTLKIQFDDELVKGKQANPEAEYIFTRAQFNYKRMIRLREDFIPEIQKGKDEFRGKH